MLPALRHALGVERDALDLRGGQDRRRAAARDDRLQRLAAEHAAGVLVDQLGERVAGGPLVEAGELDVPGEAVQPCAGRLLRADRRVLGAAVHEDPRHGGERLDVVDDRRALVEALDRGERRLVARQPLAALERVDQARFLAADVRAGAAVDDDVARECRCRGCSCPRDRPRAPPAARPRAAAAAGRTRRARRRTRAARRSRRRRAACPRSAGAASARGSSGP